jgi:small subunit ribosomal protein S6e
MLWSHLLSNIELGGGVNMANFKVVISDPKARKAYQKEIEQAQSGLMGKKLGDKVSGNHLGLSGYELELTGGSDKEGFPMRRDFEGLARKRLLLSHGPGFHPKSKGVRKRKSVRGNTISPSISQINLKIVTHGTKSVEELLGVKKEASEEKSTPKEEKKEHAEKPKEEHHEGKKSEQKKEGASAPSSHEPTSGQHKPHAEKPAKAE